jgi:DNA-binding protein H-NS
MTDYEALPYAELKELHGRIGALLDSKRTESLEQLKQQMVNLGFGPKDLARRKKGSRAPAKPKYENPENPAEKWSGRGKPPKWMQAYMEAGKDKEELAIAV